MLQPTLCLLEPQVDVAWTRLLVSGRLLMFHCCLPPDSVLPYCRDKGRYHDNLGPLEAPTMNREIVPQSAGRELRATLAADGLDIPLLP